MVVFMVLNRLVYLFPGMEIMSSPAMVGCGDKLISSASNVGPFGLYKLYTLDSLDGYVVLRLVDPVDPIQCSVRWCRLHRFFPRGC